MVQKSYKFLFSVIMPVYNVEDYLDEAIESILQQSIGFINNVEIILVDDGSTDASAGICKKYQDKFPENVKFIQQKNQGPAVARDKGAKVAEGKYLSLPDSDDKLSKNTLKKVYDFFEAHYDEIDVVTIPWEYFEARTGRDHPLNGKFYGDRVIDLTHDFSETVGSVAPSFFKQEVFKKHKSHPEVGKYSEDLRFMGEVLLDKMKFGVVCDVFYYYRKRHSQTSSQDGNLIDPFWYLETPKRVLEDLLAYTKKNNKTVPKFIQFMVMYDLQWRIKRFDSGALSPEEIEQYQTVLIKLLKQIDDDVIVSVRNIHPEVKIYALDLKYDFATRKITQFGKDLKYNKIVVSDRYSGGDKIHIDFIKVNQDEVTIEANYLGLSDSAKVYAVVGDETFTPKKVTRKPRVVKMFVDRSVEFPSQGLLFTIPKKSLRSADIRFIAEPTGEMNLEIITRRFTRLSQRNNNAYAVYDDSIVLKKRNRLIMKKNNLLRRLAYEFRYLLMVLFRFNMRIIPQPYSVRWRLIPLNAPAGRTKWRLYKIIRILLLPAMFLRSMFTAGIKTAFSLYVLPFIHQAYHNLYMAVFRVVYHLTKPYYSRKNIWLFMDRTFEGDDSAEILFEYVVAQKNPDITPIFTIKAGTDDFERISQIGKTVPFLSQYQKLLFLHAKKIISSHADDIIINPFQGSINEIVDAYDFDFVFLQHGIIKDDISNWLNRYNKNIKIFVTSARREYQSILDYQYFYDKSVVKLTGLPRYDKLDNKPENKIALAPTWRQHLALDVTDADRGYSASFKDTYYYKYYQSFVADKELNEALKKFGMTLQFYIHPSFKAQYKDFTPGDQVEIKKLPYDYKKVKSSSKLMITDFSSVVFDFAYLRKPIIYGQFDEDTYWKMHMSDMGYFSYRDDGLGPVTTDLRSTVDKIIEYMKSDFALEKVYAKRIEEFFAFDDKNNAKRVYDEILKLDVGQN